MFLLRAGAAIASVTLGPFGVLSAKLLRFLLYMLLGAAANAIAEAAAALAMTGLTMMDPLIAVEVTGLMGILVAMVTAVLVASRYRTTTTPAPPATTAARRPCWPPCRPCCSAPLAARTR
jgi:hypothetical protein